MAFFELLIDSGEGVGSGHVVRCLALGEELRTLSQGFTVRASIRGRPTHFVPPSAIPMRRVDDLGFAFHPAPDLVICDGDRSDWTDILRQLPPQVRVARITDAPDAPTNRNPAADLVISPNLAVPAPSERLLSGPDWIILRPQFDCPPQHRCRANASSAFVCLGGQPAESLLVSVLVAVLESRSPSFHEVVVVAPQEALVGAPENSRIRATYPAHDMMGLMLDADIGIVGGGTLLYEAIAVGLPSIAVSVTDDQRREGQAAAILGACKHVCEKECPRALAPLICALASERARHTMSLEAQKHIDGGGRRRVAQAILRVLFDGEHGS